MFCKNRKIFYFISLRLAIQPKTTISFVLKPSFVWFEFDEPKEEKYLQKQWAVYELNKNYELYSLALH